jgi:putative drug exporter of the RND superfamily
MAVAVAVDATVVRCVLVPAIMALLGSAGWYFPKWLERVTPKFSIEGDEWFAEHETPAQAQTETPKAEGMRSEELQEEQPQATHDNPDTRTD